MGLLHFVRNDAVMGQGCGGSPLVAIAHFFVIDVVTGARARRFCAIRLTAKVALLRRFLEYDSYSRKARIQGSASPPQGTPFPAPLAKGSQPFGIPRLTSTAVGLPRKCPRKQRRPSSRTRRGKFLKKFFTKSLKSEKGRYI